MTEGFLKELGKEQVTPSLYSDSQSAINLSNNTVYYDRTKHIDVQYHFIRILLKDGVITGEDTHESESRRYTDQGDHDKKLKACSAFVGLLW